MIGPRSGFQSTGHARTTVKSNPRVVPTAAPDAVDPGPT
jgi:hypothetical protein